MAIVNYCCLCVARSKDNTWPEELMIVMKEVEKQEHTQEKENEKKGQGILIIY